MPDSGKIVALYEGEPWGSWDEAKRTAYGKDFMKWYDQDAQPDGKLDRDELKTFIVTQASHAPLARRSSLATDLADVPPLLSTGSLQGPIGSG